MVKIRWGPHTLTVVLLITILIFALIYHFIDVQSAESQFRNIDLEDKDNFLHKLFLSVSLQATSGWSNITPKTDLVRVLTSIQMLSSIFIVLYIASYVMLKYK